MMPEPVCAVKIVGLANGQPHPIHSGRYVVSWNPHTRAGTLDITSTADLAQATRFALREVFDTWRAISKRQPRRPWDHKPNRPLTAITVEIVRLGEPSHASADSESNHRIRAPQ